MNDTVTHALGLLALTIVTLLPIMNPLSTCPLLLALTPGWDISARQRLARRVCWYSFWILAVFLLAGERIIHLFSISIEGIRIAGGLIICRVGFEMLMPGEDREIVRMKLEQTEEKQDIAFTPLAMPTLAGPGSISVVLSMVSSSPQNTELTNILVILLGISICVAIAFAVLHAATTYVHLISQTALDAFTRIMGFILVCIAVQFVLSGIAGFIRNTNFVTS